MTAQIMNQVHSIRASSPAQHRIDDVIRQAEQLLVHLDQAQRATQQRLDETGQVDPMKSITGRSAIETAIARTQSLLDDMHDLSTQPREEMLHPAIHTNSEACSELLQGYRSAIHRDTEHEGIVARIAASP